MSLARLAFYAFFYGLVSVVMHAGFHYAAVKALGGEAYMHLVMLGPLWIGDEVSWARPLPPEVGLLGYVFCYWAGGGLTGLFILAKYVLSREAEEKYVLSLVAGYHLGWSVGEAQAPFIGSACFNVATALGLTASMCLFLITILVNPPRRKASLREGGGAS